MVCPSVLTRGYSATPRLAAIAIVPVSGFQWRQPPAVHPGSTVYCIDQRPSERRGSPWVRASISGRDGAIWAWDAVGSGTGDQVPASPRATTDVGRPIASAGLPTPALGHAGGRLLRCHLLHYWRWPLLDQHDLAFQNYPIVAINRAVDLILRFAANQGQQSHNDLGAARYQRIPTAGRGDNFLPDLEAVARHGPYLGWRRIECNLEP